MLEQNRNLSQKLAECVSACNHCFSACLEEEDVKMMIKCIQLDKECALICATALQLVYGNAHFTTDMLKLCEKACRACAEECGKHRYDHCKECAKVCNECAEACRKFI